LADGKAETRVRAVICEDEPLAVRALRQYLKDVDWVEVVGEARNGKDAVRLIHKLEPELVFLDVRMPGLTGLEVLEALTHHPTVVFTTAYDEYAVSAFDFGAVDYLVKPFGRDRLVETLDRVRVRLVGEGVVGKEDGVRPGGRRYFPPRLFAQYRGNLVPVPTSEIVRVDASSGGVTLVTGAGSFDLEATLTEVQERLDPEDFIRVHRSHIVNLAHVTGIRRYDERRFTIQLDNGSTILTSRQGAKALRGIMA
jgi:two-component system LytT family response regulator